MQWLHRALCLLPLLATSAAAFAEDAPAGLVDVHFRLAPIEVHFSEELKAAAEHYAKGDWLEAIHQLTAFLEANPNHACSADCHFLMGESLVQLQRYEEAANEFEQLIKLKPNTAQLARAEFRRAEAAMLLGNLQDALRLLQQFRARYPQHELNAYGLPYLARLLAASRNPTQARILCSLALQTYPDGPLASTCRLQIAMLDYDAGEFLRAESALLRLVEHGPDDETYGDALYGLGMAQFQLGKYQAAAARLVEHSRSRPQPALADASLYFAGEAYRKLGDPAKAASVYQQLRERWPRSQYFSRSIASELKCLRQTKDASGAWALYQQLKQLGGDSTVDDGTRLVAEILLSVERFAEAHQLLTPLVEAPRSLDAADVRQQHYQNLYLDALALRGLGKSSQASELLGRVRVDLAEADLAQRVLLARVEVFNESGDFGSAIQAGRDAESQIPAGALLDAVHAQLVYALIKVNRLNEAKAKFRRIQEGGTSPDELLRAARWLGEATYAANDLVNARRVFETLERGWQSESDRAQAISGLAWIDVKQGQHASAVTRFEQFLELFPGHPSTPEVRLALAQSLLELGSMDRAVEVLTFFEQLQREHPARAEGLYRLALLLEPAPNQRERATQVAQLLVDQYPDYDRRDAALYLLGMLQRQRGSSAAERSFSTIVNEHYTSKYWSDALFRLAELATDEGDADTATRYLTKLISSERDRRVVPHGLYLKGKLEAEAKSWSEARETLRLLIRDYPDSPLVDVARYGVAESFFQEQNFTHARQLFELLDREGVPTEAAWQAMIQLRRAQLLMKARQYVDTINVAKDIAKNFPNFSLRHEADYLLGRACAARGEFTEARQHYARVVAADPEYHREISAMAQWMIGETHVHQKNFGQAIQAYKPVYTDTTFSRWRAASLLQVGKCYEKLDDVERAKRAYTRLLADDATSQWAREAARRRDALNGNTQITNRK